MLKRKLQDINTALIASVENAIAIASDLIADANLVATAELESKKYSDCRSCQLLMQNFLIAHPSASQRGKDEYFSEVVFATCTPCTEEYNAYLDQQAADWAERFEGYVDKPSDWEKENGICEHQITSYYTQLGTFASPGPGEESVYSVEKPAPVECQCGAVHSYWSKAYNRSFIGNKANGCVRCKPGRHQRETAKAASRCRLSLARHIAKSRRKGDVIYRDVAIRYLQRYGGSTFGIQTDADSREIYLEDKNGRVLGKVEYLDKYPKPPDPETYADMPF